MSGYEILPHTADLRVRARGRSLEELFRHALAGMAAVMAPRDVSRGAPGATREVSIEAADATGLLIDFLSEALALAHVHREVYPEVQFAELSPQSLRGSLHGRPVSRFARDIKAVTYHGAEVTERDGEHEVTIVCDI